MTVWAVGMVRDEIDILPYTLAHLVREGVDGLIVADNRSTDGTREWLDLLPTTLGTHTNFETFHDEEVGYYQSRKMTALAQRAFAAGADWVIPFDADELWHNAQEDKSLAATLAECTGIGGVLQAVLHNHYPTSKDPELEPNPFRRILQRDPSPSGLRKVIVARHPDVTIAQGNHSATAPEPLAQFDTRIEVAHFPWRTPEQFERKIANGYEAYLATDLPEDFGAHWRHYGELLRDGGSSALQDVFYEWFHDPELALEEAPAPWLHR